MRIAIRHEFRFAIPDGITHAVQHILMTPRDTKAQTVVEWSIAMDGIEEAANFTDAFGNIARLVSQTKPEATLSVVVTGVVDTIDNSGVIGKLDTDPNVSLFKRLTAQTKPNGNLVNRLKAQQKAGMGRVDLMHWLMNRLYEARDPAVEDGEEPVEIVAEDHAHVFIGALRGIDVPARFITGYVLDEAGGPARLHAWAEAWDDALGWIGFDPSANLCPTETYVRLAAGLDFETAAPVRLAPDLPRDGQETISVAEVTMADQQQQQ